MVLWVVRAFQADVFTSMELGLVWVEVLALEDVVGIEMLLVSFADDGSEDEFVVEELEDWEDTEVFDETMVADALVV